MLEHPGPRPMKRGARPPQGPSAALFREYSLKVLGDVGTRVLICVIWRDTHLATAAPKGGRNARWVVGVVCFDDVEVGGEGANANAGRRHWRRKKGTNVVCARQEYCRLMNFSITKLDRTLPLC
jgi:hypothetical protein